MHIAIAGNIGSGKTTLTQLLANHFNCNAEFESVENNPYLSDFYTDMPKWAFHLELHFLNSRFRQTRRIQQSNEWVVQDRSIDEGVHIFAKNLFDSKCLSKRDYNTYMTLYNFMLEQINSPDLLIYLKADIDKLVSQIKMRNRSFEQEIPVTYLENLNALYAEWINTVPKERLMVIDIQSTDFKENPNDFENIVTKIDSFHSQRV
ncbi:deoxynucleoside kinase [Aureibacter tunicatorum]|uniref:Deoxyadenosine/deoxycytidine kinase n=1 Tax=Aureibacter tunicatorum TaxID=866807 RepID=A0AAE4BRV7_9BACT|nr:deoxynucleoside kinase [Aureibacter tunicatorum]MDR6239096.1 deoxyadenosine/deoxycytidine kinase [Aureibacter tunicatorum]BDD04978.1 deoxynucleoside kinase [Aureibacter tunicatorum]